MVFSGLAVLIVIALVIIVGSRTANRATEAGWIKAGSAEFSPYAQSIKISDMEKSTAATLIGRKLGYVQANIQNTGNRTITGLKLRAVAVGFANETMAERIATPIPRQRDKLAPNETIHVNVQIDPIPDPDQMMDMKIEVYAVKFQ